MRLDAVTREECVEVEDGQGLSPGGSKKSLGREEEKPPQGSEEIPVEEGGSKARVAFWSHVKKVYHGG